jgi:hypothetical protein
MHRCTCFVVSTDVLTRVALNSPDLVQKAAIRSAGRDQDAPCSGR